MSSFTSDEIAYLNSQLLGRLATVDPDGNPHVVPVGFRYNPEFDTIDIGGFGLAQSKKYRNIATSGRAAFVIDDLISVDPWQGRMLQLRGVAETMPSGGNEILAGFAPEMIRIHPKRIVSYSINGDEPEDAMTSRTIA